VGLIVGIGGDLETETAVEGERSTHVVDDDPNDIELGSGHVQLLVIVRSTARGAIVQLSGTDGRGVLNVSAMSAVHDAGGRQDEPTTEIAAGW